VSTSLPHGTLLTMTSPGVLIDVALLNTLGGTSSSSSRIAERLLPTIASILESVTSHTSRPAHVELPITDPLVAYAPDDEADKTVKTSEYDLQGRSKAARLVEGVARLLRADRQLSTNEPEMLRIVLAARVLVQDAQILPTGSRGFLAPTTPLEYLEDSVREIDGVMSYALSSIDDTPAAWHKATIALLQTSKSQGSPDWLQKVLLVFADDVRKTSGDVSARALRDVLARHLRQSGAGAAEGEMWLQFATTLMERCE
jgi:hypothetical protein